MTFFPLISTAINRVVLSFIIYNVPEYASPGPKGPKATVSASFHSSVPISPLIVGAEGGSYAESNRGPLASTFGNIGVNAANSSRQVKKTVMNLPLLL